MLSKPSWRSDWSGPNYNDLICWKLGYKQCDWKVRWRGAIVTHRQVRTGVSVGECSPSMMHSADNGRWLTGWLIVIDFSWCELYTGAAIDRRDDWLVWCQLVRHDVSCAIFFDESSNNEKSDSRWVACFQFSINVPFVQRHSINEAWWHHDTCCRMAKLVFVSICICR